jgi:4'-phosphopantetheinyl transferase
MTPLISWESPARHPELLDGDIHLWLADLNRPALIPAAREILTATETERGLRYYFERDQIWFFARHFYLRTLLADYLHQPARDLDIRLTPAGKPYLEGDPIHFNLSDSGGWCLFAFTHLAPLGVDLETVREQVNMAGIARRYFSEAEQAELESLPSDLQTEAFYHIWTQKEAFIKAVGEGLSIPLAWFDVAADPRQPGEIRAVRGAGPQPVLSEVEGSWKMRTFIPLENFWAAVCVGTAESVNLRTFKV